MEIRIDKKAKSARSKSNVVIFVFCLFMISRIVTSEEIDVVGEKQLVDLYQATAQKSLFQRDKWIIEVNDQSTTMKGDMPKIVTGKFTQKYTVYRDGDNIDSRSERSGSLGKNSERKYATRTSQFLLIDGRVYDYQRREGLEDEPKFVVARTDLTRRVINSAGSRALALAGYMHGDLKPLAEILTEETSVLHMLPSMQMVNGFPTYVLEATTPYGHYTVWMDPNCGYSPRRVIVERGPKDLYDGKPVSTPRPPPSPGYTRKPRPTREHVRFTMEISKIKEIDGGFMATEGSTTLSTVFSDDSKEEIHGVCEFTLMDLNPDFSKISDAFVLGVPNGIQVLNMDFPGGKFKWQNGKMVPDVDDLIIEQLENTAEEIMNEKTVPSGLGSVENTAISNKEPNSVLDTQTDITGSKSEVLAESHGLPIIVLIPIVLLIIVLVGWMMFRHLRFNG